MSLAEHLNALEEAEAAEALRSCCAAPRWVTRMVAARPFPDEASVLAMAERIWWSLGRDDWLAAFAAHPRIGGDVEALGAKHGRSASMSETEQAGVSGASEATLQALADENEAYEARFDHVFLVCATGKSADEMLAILRERIDNRPSRELRVVAEEQMKITRLRLRKLGARADLARGRGCIGRMHRADASGGCIGRTHRVESG